MVRQLLLGSKQETVVAWTSMWQWGWKGVKALGGTGEKIDEYWCPLLTSLRVWRCGERGKQNSFLVMDIVLLHSSASSLPPPNLFLFSMSIH